MFDIIVTDNEHTISVTDNEHDGNAFQMNQDEIQVSSLFFFKFCFKLTNIKTNLTFRYPETTMSPGPPLPMGWRIDICRNIWYSHFGCIVCKSIEGVYKTETPGSFQYPGSFIHQNTKMMQK